MKNILWLPALIALIALTHLPASPALAEQPKWRMRVDLSDGSRVVGVPSSTKLKLDMDFVQFEIPLERVRRADRQSGKQTFRVQLGNNDMLTGTISPKSLSMATLFGDVTLPMNQVEAFSILPRVTYGWLPTRQGLVAYYSFDRPIKDKVENLAGDNHQGTLTEVKWSELGARGGCTQFAGKSRITIPHHQDLCPAAMTLSAWIRPTGDRGGYATVVSKSEYSWAGGYALVTMSGDPNHVHFYVNGYTAGSVKAEAPTDRWTHLVGVCDGEALTIYRNGEEVQSRSLSGSSGGDEAKAEEGSESRTRPSSQIRHTATPLFIGSGHAKYDWSGQIDEVALYNRPLNAGEIKRLYESVQEDQR